jgi:hypothetical protein
MLYYILLIIAVTWLIIKLCKRSRSRHIEGFYDNLPKEIKEAIQGKEESYRIDIEIPFTIKPKTDKEEQDKLE